MNRWPCSYGQSGRRLSNETWYRHGNLQQVTSKLLPSFFDPFQVGQHRTVEQVHIAHRGGDIGVTEQTLYGGHWHPLVQQVAGTSMSGGVPGEVPV